MRKYVMVSDVFVDAKIFTTHFECAYEHCKGACCWTPDTTVPMAGGQLLETEAKELVSKVNEVSPFVPREHRTFYKRRNYTRVKGTPCTTLHKHACVFSDSANKTCALKTAHSQGELSYPIPVHCQLYPVVESKREGKKALRIEDYFPACSYAYIKGRRNNTLLLHWLEEPITRLMGKDFYQALEQKRVSLL